MFNGHGLDDQDTSWIQVYYRDGGHFGDGLDIPLIIFPFNSYTKCYGEHKLVYHDGISNSIELS